MQIRFFRAASIFLCCVFLNACVPTPAMEAVTNKSDGALEQQIRQPPVPPYTYQHPEEWNETISLKNLDLVFDAVVESAGNNQFPIQTIQRTSFTSETVYQLLDRLFPGKKEGRTNAFSIQEIVYELQMLNRGDFVDYDSLTGEYIWEHCDDFEEQEQHWKTLLKNADQDHYETLSEKMIRWNGEMNVVRTDRGESLYLYATNDYLQIGKNRQFALETESQALGGFGFAGEQPHSLEDSILREEDVRQQATAILNQLPEEGWGIASVEKARIIESLPEAPYFQPSDTGYLVSVARTARAYLPIQTSKYYDNDWIRMAQSGDEDYAPSWWIDEITLYFDASGLSSFTWNHPNKVVLTANENVQLMGFSEIQQKVRNIFHYSFAWTDDAASIPYQSIYVDRIILSLGIIQIPNQKDEAFLCPMWIVLFSDDRSRETKLPQSAIVINAIDGSYIRQY